MSLKVIAYYWMVPVMYGDELVICQSSNMRVDVKGDAHVVSKEQCKTRILAKQWPKMHKTGWRAI